MTKKIKNLPTLDLNIVLYEPEIPQNTGNIMRTCVAVGAKLHLIEPLGFSLDEKHLRRSGLDYIPKLDYFVYKDYEEFLLKNSEGEKFFLSRYGKKNYNDIDFTKASGKIYLIFGKESTGVDRHLLAKNLDKTYRIPTTDNVRSINLSNAVAILVYQVEAQYQFPGLYDHEPETLKGADFLDQFIENDNKWKRIRKRSSYKGRKI